MSFVIDIPQTKRVHWIFSHSGITKKICHSKRLYIVKKIIIIKIKTKFTCMCFSFAAVSSSVRLIILQGEGIIMTMHLSSEICDSIHFLA